MNKMLIFGAGKIGRSFIGQIFSRAGYEIVFVDIDPLVVNELNRRQGYEVHIKDKHNEKLEIKNVKGVIFSDKSKIIDELITASILAVSVGKAGLQALIPVLAEGIHKRYKKGVGPVDLIIAENMRNADLFLWKALQKLLPSGFPLKECLGLVETSIGKMVPIMPPEISSNDPLLVYAEAYNTLIVDKKGFINPIPDVKSLTPKNNMKAWVDRKLFIHNFGHAATAYLGYAHNRDFMFTWEPLQIPDLYNEVYGAMKQSSEALLKLYPEEFTRKELDTHIVDLLDRFQNKNLGDTIYRVGSDLYRKLGPEDRIVTPLKTAIRFQLLPNKIQRVLFAAFAFKVADADGRYNEKDLQFFQDMQKGEIYILKKVCGLTDIEIDQLTK